MLPKHLEKLLADIGETFVQYIKHTEKTVSPTVDEQQGENAVEDHALVPIDDDIASPIDRKLETIE